MVAQPFNAAVDAVRKEYRATILLELGKAALQGILANANVKPQRCTPADYAEDAMDAAEALYAEWEKRCG